MRYLYPLDNVSRIRTPLLDEFPINHKYQNLNSNIKIILFHFLFSSFSQNIIHLLPFPPAKQQLFHINLYFDLLHPSSILFKISLIIVLIRFRLSHSFKKAWFWIIIKKLNDCDFYSILILLSSFALEIFNNLWIPWWSQWCFIPIIFCIYISFLIY